MSLTPRSVPRRVASALTLGLVMLLGVVAFAPTGVSAGEALEGECYVQVEEFRYERGEPGQDEIVTWQKQYRESLRTRQSDTDAWGEWGEWGEWIDVGEPLTTEPFPKTGDYGSWFWADGLTEVGREYHYVRVVTYVDTPGDYEETDWLTEPPEEGEGWTIKEGPRVTPGQTFPCPSADATPGTCEAPGVITPSESEYYTSTIVDGVVTFTPVPPAVFGTDVQAEFDFSDRIAQLTDEQCDDTPPPPPTNPPRDTTTTTEAPTPTTPTTTPTTEDTTPPAEVGGLVEESGVGSDGAEVLSGSGELPRTGAGVGGLLLVGGLLSGVGALLRFASRRT